MSASTEPLQAEKSSSERRPNSVESRFEIALEELFAEIKDTHRAQSPRIYEANLLPYLYTSPKGALLAEEIFAGADSNYGLPEAEFTLVRENADVYPQIIIPGAIHVSVGNGPDIPVLRKDLPTTIAANSGGYVAIDIEKNQAQLGAGTIGRKRGLATSFLAIDFMKPFDLRAQKLGNHAIGDRPLFLTMYGATAGNVDLYKLLTNLDNATNGKAVMLFTMGAKKNQSVVDEYRGGIMNQFMRSLWEYAGDVVTNHGTTIPRGKFFNPQAFTPIEEYDAQKNAVVHDVVVTGDTHVPIGNNKWAKLPLGARIRTGSSVQVDKNDISPVIAAAKWNVIDVPFTAGGLVHPVVIAAKNTPKEWIPILSNSSSAIEKDGHYTRHQPAPSPSASARATLARQSIAANTNLSEEVIGIAAPQRTPASSHRFPIGRGLGSLLVAAAANS